MCKYVAFYNRKQIEVEGMTSYEAQRKAAEFFGVKNAWKVGIYLIEKDGKEVGISTIAL